jgi:phospholipid N-methyltransferase
MKKSLLFITSLFFSLIAQASEQEMYENVISRGVQNKEAPLFHKIKFFEFPDSHFEKAPTPQAIIQDVISSDSPKILEIGSAQGNFIKTLASKAAQSKKIVNGVCIDYLPENRETLKQLINILNVSPFNQNFILSKNPDVIDYIKRNPENKKGFFSHIISYWTLHCLSPSDMLTVLESSQDFLQEKGHLWLTLRTYHGMPNAEKAKKSLQESLEKDSTDVFRGFNWDKEETTKNILNFLFNTQTKSYETVETFSHDFAAYNHVFYDTDDVKNILTTLGFDIEICEIDHEYGFSFGYKDFNTFMLKVKAIKNSSLINQEKISLLKNLAKGKEQTVFELYKLLSGSVIFKKK